MKIKILSMVSLLCLSQFVWAVEDMKYIDYVNSSAIKTEALVSDKTTAKPNQTALSLGVMYKDFSELHLDIPTYIFTWRVYQPERNIAWYLNIFSSLSESKMNSGYYGALTNGSQTVYFDAMSLFGLGGGIRANLEKGFAVDCGFDLISLNNAATNSGFNGFSINGNLVYKHILSPTLSFQPKLGFQWYSLGGAKVNGPSGSLSSPVSGVNYQIGVELETLL